MKFTLKQALETVVFLSLFGFFFYSARGVRPMDQPWNFLHQNGVELSMLVLGLWGIFRPAPVVDPVFAYRQKYQRVIGILTVVMALAVMGLRVFAPWFV